MKKSLSLLELLVAVSILAIGISYVLRSFWGSLTAIEIVENRVAALRLIDSKLNTIDAKMTMGEYPVAGSHVEELDLGSRMAVYKELVEDFVPDGISVEEIEELDENFVEPTLRLVRVTSSLAWQEAGRDRDQSMSFVLAVPIEEEEIR